MCTSHCVLLITYTFTQYVYSIGILNMYKRTENISVVAAHVVNYSMM